MLTLLRIWIKKGDEQGRGQRSVCLMTVSFIVFRCEILPMEGLFSWRCLDHQETTVHTCKWL